MRLIYKSIYAIEAAQFTKEIRDYERYVRFALDSKPEWTNYFFANFGRYINILRLYK